jgi:hypothetical protein
MHATDFSDSSKISKSVPFREIFSSLGKKKYDIGCTGFSNVKVHRKMLLKSIDGNFSETNTISSQFFFGGDSFSTEIKQSNTPEF